MELIRSLSQLHPHHQQCVATIGNFDGVHLGHQAVFAQLIDKAQSLNLPSQVISFEPQPQEFFVPDKAPPRLTRLREKVQILQQFPISRMLCLRFNSQLANLSAEDFITRVLVDGLAIRYLIVGDDFRFGRGRQGNFALLQAAGDKYGFEVANTPTFMRGGGRVSSTRVREALSRGNMDVAQRLLGHAYSLNGRVAHGRQLGRQLGFPTANIHLHRKSVPVKGVFAVSVTGIAAQPLPAIANIGVRPTLDGAGMRPLLEVHLFDFQEDIYGRYVDVALLKYLRAEQKFDGLEALKRQIEKDCQAARGFFAQQPFNVGNAGNNNYCVVPA